MKNKPQKSGSVRGFFRGVFWTTYIGMGAFIAYPHLKVPAAHTTTTQTHEMAEALRLSVEDLK